MALQADLLGSITRVLPHLDDDTVASVIDFLIEEGVKKLPDLRHITIDLLKRVLDHVDSSELYEEWQKVYGNRNNSNTVAPASSRSSQQPSTSRPPLATLQSNAQAVIKELPVFDLESPYLPTRVKTAIRNKMRPTSGEREDMVNRIVDRCKEVVPNLTKDDLVAVAFQLVQMYGDSFRDTIPISNHGSDSLAFQLKTKLDNGNRPAPDLSVKEKEAPAFKEAVGCISWNPSLANDECEESQMKTMQELQKMHKISPQNWEWALIKRKLLSSYYLQRKDINGKLANSSNAKTTTRKRKRKDDVSSDEDRENESDDIPDLSIQEIQERWPFLLTAKGINIHFTKLTGKDFSSLVCDYIAKNGDNLIDFMAGTSNELLAMRRAGRLAESQGFGSVPLSTILLMLIKYFKEDKSHFITSVERTAQLDEVADSVTFPDAKTPILICAGPNIFDHDKIFFAIDNAILCTASNILEGLTLLFCSYFVFNYVYSPSLSCVLTFIQKAILNINPLKKSKCVDTKTGASVNKKVLAFNNKFISFDQNARASANLNDM